MIDFFNGSLLGSEFKGHLLESIVLEYVHGENLDLLVARSKALHENMIRIYTQQIFDAILYMHSKNVIHRFFFQLFLFQVCAFFYNVNF